jgi:hypothetical protein
VDERIRRGRGKKEKRKGKKEWAPQVEYGIEYGWVWKKLI